MTFVAWMLIHSRGCTWRHSPEGKPITAKCQALSKALKCWCLGGGRSLVHMHNWMHYHTAYFYSMHANNNTCSNQCMQPSCSFVYSSRTVWGVGYVHRRLSNIMNTCSIWACARLMCHQQRAKAAALLSFGVLVFMISPGSLSILWYRWTF